MQGRATPCASGAIPGGCGALGPNSPSVQLTQDSDYAFMGMRHGVFNCVFLMHLVDFLIETRHFTCKGSKTLWNGRLILIKDHQFNLK